MTTPIATTAPNVIPTAASGENGRFLVSSAAGVMGGGGGGAGGGGDGSVQASTPPGITQKTY